MSAQVWRRLALALLLPVSAGCAARGQQATSPGTPPADPTLQVSVLSVSRATTGAQDLQITVKITNSGVKPIQGHAAQLSLLSAEGDIFAQAGPPGPPGLLDGLIGPGASRSGRLTFVVPAAAASHACLLLRTVGGNVVSCTHLDTLPTSGLPVSASTVTTITEYALDGGTGNPWGLAADASGNVWFAEPGCNAPLLCSSTKPPGALGVRLARSHALHFYTLPDIPGNQPFFVAVDGSGNIWFTTPNNSMIGEFDPVTQRFVGQWAVVPDSGPWTLIFSQGMLWFTENYIAGIGEFDPATHHFRDFPTPTPDSHPYGIAADDAATSHQVWFTENSSKVARIGVLDTSNGNIAEYAIRAQPGTSLTPHLIALDAVGRPWWTEGGTRAIGTLDPHSARPGLCGSSTGDCTGVAEYYLPPTPTSCPHSHLSGIAIGSQHVIWLDDSLAAQIGSFDPSTGQFSLYPMSDCNVHPHDGLVLDTSQHVWWSEEFANTVAELA